MLNRISPIFDDVTRHVVPAVDSYKIRLEIYAKVNLMRVILDLKQEIIFWVKTNVKVGFADSNKVNRMIMCTINAT